MEHNDILTIGHKTILAEAGALSDLSDSLDETFSQAVRRMNVVTGRVIVTGMGKSGHIARKIAATLASTGRPAQFVHPSEAAHGDLGMITENDAILALSKSGNSVEFTSMLEYAARLGIPILAMTANRESELARFAEIVLCLPALGETPMVDTPAPTLSTTMMLAYGDALAVALLQMRGFTREDFAKLHPGGLLGTQLSTVARVMHTGDEIPLIGQQQTIRDAVMMISQKRFGCTGVLEDQRLVGIITDGDLRRHLKHDLLDQIAGKIATREPLTITPDLLCVEAINIMEHNKITALFVVEDTSPVGIVHLHDLLNVKVR